MQIKAAISDLEIRKKINHVSNIKLLIIKFKIWLFERIKIDKPLTDLIFLKRKSTN